MAGTAYAATTLFTQTFPAIPAQSLPGCSGPGTTPPKNDLTANVAAVTTGNSGAILFDCSGSAPFGTTPAFNTTAAMTMTPSFTLPQGYTALFVYAAAFKNIGTDCSGGYPQRLTSGSAITLSGSTYQWDYCATYFAAPATGLATFTISWSG